MACNFCGLLVVLFCTIAIGHVAGSMIQKDSINSKMVSDLSYRSRFDDETSYFNLVSEGSLAIRFFNSSRNYVVNSINITMINCYQVTILGARDLHMVGLNQDVVAGTTHFPSPITQKLNDEAKEAQEKRRKKEELQEQEPELNRDAHEPFFYGQGTHDELVRGPKIVY